MFFVKILLSGILFVMSGAVMAENRIAVEWAPFVKNNDVTDQQLIAAADKVNSDFLMSQSGFIKRELIKKSDNEYADVIHWNSKTDAEIAGSKVNNCVPCGQYFGLMDMVAGESAGAGFSHYSILKAWN